jgi:hypothetical protein
MNKRNPKTPKMVKRPKVTLRDEMKRRGTEDSYTDMEQFFDELWKQTNKVSGSLE